MSNKNLPVKKNKKRNYKKVQRQQKRAAAGESIDKRPKEIDTREEFGNWEMDSVLGKRGKSKNTLLVLTERKTRNEIIFKLPDHTDEAVVAALDRLERKWGADMFKRVFKTITVDNGSLALSIRASQWTTAVSLHWPISWNSPASQGISGRRYITATRTAVGSVAQMR